MTPAQASKQGGTKPNRRRILCFEESIWTDHIGLLDQTSVLPTLELLQRMGVVEEFAHRHVLGADEFRNYLSWRGVGRRTAKYGVIYLAFHGSGQGLRVGASDVSLDELAELLGPVPGVVVHLGSCSVLRSKEVEVRRFLKATGAQMVSGYERDVEWMDSAALDTAWLGYLAEYPRVGDAERYFRLRYSSVIDYLKWQAIR